MKQCAYRDCEIDFESPKQNQKYCCGECCKKEMNARAKDAYERRANRLAGEERTCIFCDVRLNRYNPAEVCGPCQKKNEESANITIQRMLGL